MASRTNCESGSTHSIDGVASNCLVSHGNILYCDVGTQALTWYQLLAVILDRQQRLLHMMNHRLDEI
jgi:hypothetical protein